MTKLLYCASVRCFGGDHHTFSSAHYQQEGEYITQHTHNYFDYWKQNF